MSADVEAFRERVIAELLKLEAFERQQARLATSTQRKRQRGERADALKGAAGLVSRLPAKALEPDAS